LTPVNAKLGRSVNVGARRSSVTHLIIAVLAVATLAPGGRPAVAAEAGPHVAACTAAAPAPGTRIAGPVLQVMDGESLCLAKGPNPADWLLIRLANMPNSSERRVLMAAAFAEKVECVVERRSTTGVVATCWKDGAPLAALVQDAGVREKAALWR
jgi:micrococcal nuclease